MTDIKTLTMPVLPLRDIVLFPNVTVPIAAGRPGTLKAIEAAARSHDRTLFAVTQREGSQEKITPEGLYTVGTIARFDHLQRGISGVQLLLAGQTRGIAVRISEKDGHLEAVVREAEEMPPISLNDSSFVALYREVRQRAAELGQKAGLPKEAVQQVLGGVEDPGRFADLVAAYTDAEVADRQALLETLSVEERLRRVLVLVQRQISVLDAQEDIKSKVQEELGGRQREMVLREQLRAIQKELGEDDFEDDLIELKEKLDELALPEEARKEVDRELKRLSRIGREAMEAQVIRTYLETIAELPWNERSEEQLDLNRAAEILEEDHYGLRDVKDRVLEFLAVRQLRQAQESERRSKAAAGDREGGVAAEPQAAGEGAASTAQGVEGAEGREGEAEAGESEAEARGSDGDGRPGPEAEPPGEELGAGGAGPAVEDAGESGAGDGAVERTGNDDDKAGRSPILLFVGPPGVGKTSIARSIARSMGRKYVRISLGGARDEADIRGHRRTYVGAMPGRIIHGMKQVGTRNPVFLLDEVDKLGVSFQGDPAAALLEVLDPAQNDSFTDHYLGVPFDLSEVLFICTANFLQNIPGPLLDRMEMVEFSGYTDAEKLAIAKQYLVPRQLTENAVKPEQLTFRDDAIAAVISGYTREAGVRQLEREIGRLSRKVARKIATGEVESLALEAPEVRTLLGRPRVHPERAARHDQVGVATGMFYTPVGGDIMFVEASTMKGKGELVLTGQLGDVMKESARAAWTYARAHSQALQIPDDAFQSDLHIHVPAGAIPKDGPSAGITMATAAVSALSGRPVRPDVAMTGEVTLSGRVLPIGGVKEKILGAVRAGIGRFILPRENDADLEDLPEEVRNSIEVHLVDELGEVLALTLRDATYQEGRLYFAGDNPDDVVPLSMHLRH